MLAPIPRSCISPVPAVAALVVALNIAGCGGGSDGGSGASPPPPAAVQTTVTGTAASGKPTAGATVTIKDASGNSATGTTGTDGTFKVTSTTKFSPPLLVQVGAGAGATMYSVSADTNLTTMINVTPLTDLVVRSYYNVQGVTADTAFGALASNPPPAAATVQILGNAVQSTVQLWLNNAGVANAGFNLISTPFNADGTGVDKVLDETTVTTSSNTLKITDGTTTQTSTLAAAATGTVTITTTTTNGATTSTASQSVAVPTSAAQQTDLAKALAGVQTMFTNVIGAAAAKGASFAAADAMAFIDTGYLSQGQNAASFAMTFASFVNTLPAGAKVSVNGFVRTNQFTDTSATNQTLNVTVDLLETLSDGSTVHNYLDNSDDVGTGEVYRLQSDGSWRFYGDQSIAKAHVQVQQSRFYEANNTGAPNTPSNALQLQGQVSVATGTLTTVSLSGPADSLPDCSTVTNGQTPVPLTLMSVVLMKDAGIFNGNQDRYDLPCTAAFGFPVITTAPAAGTPYVFSVTPVSSGVAVSQPSTLNSATTDNGDFTTINGMSRASFAAGNTVAMFAGAGSAGTTLTVSFTPPTTFPILYSTLRGFCENANEKANGGGSDSKGARDNIPPGMNSGTITVPAMCDGAPIALYNLNVDFVGVNGERSSVGQDFHF